MERTLEEAIKYYSELAEENEKDAEQFKRIKATQDIISHCYECAEEHRQLAEWLRELKELRKITQHRVHPACSDCKYLKVDVNKPCRNCCNNYRSMFEREINADEDSD